MTKTPGTDPRSVTAITPATGTGTVTAINGLANAGANGWKASVDGAAAAAASRSATVGVGDTVYLRYGA
jgi:hypothetical protein